MTQIVFSAHRPDESPIPQARVTVRLIAGPNPTDPGFIVGAGFSVLSKMDQTTNSAGTLTLDLPSTDDGLMGVDGCFYEVSVNGAKRTIVVPAAGGPFDWGDPSIQVISPVPPSFSYGTKQPTTPVDAFFDFPMTAGTWATLEAGGDPGTYVIDRTTGGSPPATGIYTLAAATWTFVRALVPGELIQAQAAVGAGPSFDPEGGAPFLYCVEADGTLGRSGVVASQVGFTATDVPFTGTGLMELTATVSSALMGTEGALDGDRSPATYIHATEFDSAWVSGPVVSQPIGRDGHQLVNGESVVVIGQTDGSWIYSTDESTGQWTTGIFGGGSNALTGGNRFDTALGVHAHFLSTTGGTTGIGPDRFLVTTSTGTWRIAPWPMSGSGAPDDTLGEDGCTYYDLAGAPTPDVYLKASGSWTAIGSLAVAI